MRIETESPDWFDTFCRSHGLDVQRHYRALVLNQRERDTLRRAASICERARSVFQVDSAMHYEFGRVEHGARDLADSDRFVIKEAADEPNG